MPFGLGSIIHSALSSYRAKKNTEEIINEAHTYEPKGIETSARFRSVARAGGEECKLLFLADLSVFTSAPVLSTGSDRLFLLSSVFFSLGHTFTEILTFKPVVMESRETSL